MFTEMMIIFINNQKRKKEISKQIREGGLQRYETEKKNASEKDKKMSLNTTSTALMPTISKAKKCLSLQWMIAFYFE